MKPSKFIISLPIESYEKTKTAENCQNFYDAEKHIVSKLSKISLSNFDRTIQRLENFTSLSSIISKIYTVKAVRVGKGQFISSSICDYRRSVASLATMHTIMFTKMYTIMFTKIDTIIFTETYIIMFHNC